MLKKFVLLSCFFASLLMFWGCPYSSIVPLSKPVELIMPELIGSWVPENEAKSEFPSYYSIEKYDTVRYAIAHFQYNKDDEAYSSKDYVGHTTYLEGILFMNLVGSGSKEYLIHRIDLIPGGFKLFEVTENIDEKFESTEEMRKFFIENMKSSFFYTKDEVTLLKK
ncbi:MAG: hypothetical protein ACI9LA_001700 [Bacteroidia bacterium]|jgi:hypothetical protein